MLAVPPQDGGILCVTGLISDIPQCAFMPVGLGTQRSTTANLRSGRGRKEEQGRGAPRIGLFGDLCVATGGDPGSGISYADCWCCCSCCCCVIATVGLETAAVPA